MTSYPPLSDSAPVKKVRPDLVRVQTSARLSDLVQQARHLVPAVGPLRGDPVYREQLDDAADQLDILVAVLREVAQ